ncbi:MAG: hypothetical protein K940chlam1_00692 [Candidatus Anoxychlamydiales bacterium]|nr:hypothetical protein [Candidatus Anoxychlamydiales bacterium]
MKFLKIIFKVLCMVSPLASPLASPIKDVNEQVYSQIHEISPFKEIEKDAQVKDPDMIIFDTLLTESQNLEDIKKGFEDTDIDLILLHYIPKEKFVIDDKIVDIQNKILIKEQRWVSDTEALEYLKDNRAF